MAQSCLRAEGIPGTRWRGLSLRSRSVYRRPSTRRSRCRDRELPSNIDTAADLAEIGVARGCRGPASDRNPVHLRQCLEYFKPGAAHRGHVPSAPDFVRENQFAVEEESVVMKP